MNSYFIEYEKNGQLYLKDRPVLLASSSPRRQELLRSLVPDFETASLAFDERQWTELFFLLDQDLTHLPAYLALKKAQALARPDTIILSGDTLVVADQKILGKPRDRDQARLMLESLFGRTHQVFTGACILLNQAYYAFSTRAQVRFSPYHAGLKEPLEAYLASDQPLDKAGAYGIQEIGPYFVEAIEGDYYGIMGLPMASLRRLFYDFSWFEEDGYAFF